jgi:hypothetical protein
VNYRNPTVELPAHLIREGDAIGAGRLGPDIVTDVNPDIGDMTLTFVTRPHVEPDGPAMLVCPSDPLKVAHDALVKVFVPDEWLGGDPARPPGQDEAELGAEAAMTGQPPPASLPGRVGWHRAMVQKARP